MCEILKSQGIICFFVLIMVMGVLSSNSINSMNENGSVKEVVVINENFE